MLIGYARISKADGSQSRDLQRDALREAGVSDDAIYEDQASGQREDRPGLAAFLKAARQGDVIVVWRLDRLGRNLRHLVNLVQDLNDRTGHQMPLIACTVAMRPPISTQPVRSHDAFSACSDSQYPVVGGMHDSAC